MKDKESEEMYLETILVIKNRGSAVRSIDIVAELNYAKSSVSRAVNLLVKRGYITIGAGGEIDFTAVGKQKAIAIYDRHEVLTKALIAIGADRNSAEDNACRIEHVLSEDVYTLIKNHVNNAQNKKQSL